MNFNGIHGIWIITVLILREQDNFIDSFSYLILTFFLKNPEKQSDKNLLNE